MEMNSKTVTAMNTGNSNDYFDLANAYILPALTRKIYLAKCLDEGNWDAIRYDLNKRPVDDVNGNASEEEILEILNFHGIYCITSTNGEVSTVFQIWEEENTLFNSGTRNNTSIMELANQVKEVTGFKGFFRYNATKADVLRPADTALDHDPELRQMVQAVYQQFLEEL